METICVSPTSFPGLCSNGETPAPERSKGERGGFRAAKALRKQGREHLEEEAPL